MPATIPADTAPTVLVEKVEPHITTITLDRPDRLNALDCGRSCP
jgi:enoyl-CoA hydratase/carnithine racemase